MDDGLIDRRESENLLQLDSDARVLLLQASCLEPQPTLLLVEARELYYWPSPHLSPFISHNRVLHAPTA